MPGYIEKQLSKYNHPTPKWPQHSPYPCAPKTYRKSAQDPIATNNSPPAGQEGITHVPKFVGRILYYAHSVDSTPRVALNALASKQAHATEKTIKHEPHIRLLSDESKRNSKILPIRHDLKRAFRCIVSFSKKRQES